ncbi:MAG: methylated-DNA--[protein]-cysteine S-methyltransferase, partial [Sphingomonadaceae bacterium]|nr:methylated-DNA--[protein]-cysteine S-methyltransferase [Sphingomonadaceae bacterium]
GFRACRRCLPDDVSREEAALAKALSILRGASALVSLAQLAAQVGYSPTHFQRIFKRGVGLSPAAYSRALRMGRAGDALSDGAGVTEAVYQAGYGAPSRFYEASRERLGMTPSAWRNGGQGAAICWAQVETTLGPMLVAATDKGVCRLSFGEGPGELAARFPNANLLKGGASFEKLISDVVAAVEQPGHAHTIPLDVQGTAFQEAIWAQLRIIPPGETRSYGEIAAAIGKPGAVRAAGSANGANHVAVLIPCHRVIRSDGSLGGYAWGEDIKRELLRRERGDD